MILLSPGITKHDVGYTAVVTSRSHTSDPPEVVWSSFEPMSERHLTEILDEIGCHLIDVYDAFAAADPEIRKAYQQAREKISGQGWSPLPEQEAQRIVQENQVRVQAQIKRMNQDERTYWEDTERRLRERFGSEEAIKILNSATKSKYFIES